MHVELSTLESAIVSGKRDVGAKVTTSNHLPSAVSASQSLYLI